MFVTHIDAALYRKMALDFTITSDVLTGLVLEITSKEYGSAIERYARAVALIELTRMEWPNEVRIDCKLPVLRNHD